MLTVKQAAERLGVCQSLVYGWVESRRLAHYRAGAKGRRGRVLIAEADLDSFLESLKVEADGPVRKPISLPARKLELRHLSLP